MDIPSKRKNLPLMRAMFGEIAPRYDFVSRVFSYGMDGRWKRQGLQKVALSNDSAVLDLASGTGDFSRLVLDQFPQARVVAVDLTEQMLSKAQRRGIPNVVCGDACALPFAAASFDCVFIGYGVRNFPILAASIKEVERVIRPGGQLVTLDFFLPENAVLRPLYLGYLYAACGFWGLILHGRPSVYTYVPDSIRSFVSVNGFSELLQGAGYASVEARHYIFGGIGMHWATKK